MSDSPALAAHPYAELFPMLSARELGELADDICTFGQREKIVLLDGQVLDGRNRLAACGLAGVEPQFEDYAGDEPLYFVLSRNLQRRHLTESQRAMVAAKLVDWDVGINQTTAGSANLPAHAAAERLSISERAIQSAKRIHERGAPELVRAIADGRVSVHAGEELSRMEHAAQRDVLERQEREIIARAKEIRTARMAASRQQRLDRLAGTASRNDAVLAALPRAAFAVLYADVPWPQLDVWNEENGNDRAYPYPTMELDAIKALCAGENSPATKDAVLFFWTTANRLDVAVDVIRAWGFCFKTSMVWDKVHMGTGRWVRDRHEVLMIATRGDIPAPLPGTQPQSLFAEPKGDHSAKPDCVRQMIDNQFPGLSKLELFARGPVKGWSVWGNEAAT